MRIINKCGKPGLIREAQGERGRKRGRERERERMEDGQRNILYGLLVQIGAGREQNEPRKRAAESNKPQEAARVVFDQLGGVVRHCAACQAFPGLLL